MRAMVVAPPWADINQGDAAIMARYSSKAHLLREACLRARHECGKVDELIEADALIGRLLPLLAPPFRSNGTAPLRLVRFLTPAPQAALRRRCSHCPQGSFTMSQQRDEGHDMLEQIRSSLPCHVACVQRAMPCPPSNWGPFRTGPLA